MKVTVEYNHYVLRKITGKEAEHLQVGDASSFQDLLALLENRYGKAFTDLVTDPVNGSIRSPILVNGEGVSDPRRLLRSGDRIHILARTTSG
jgi:molybdopterin converting factor small subunit